MATQSVWVYSVDVDRVMKLLNDGYGKLSLRWNDRIWDFWQRLGWCPRSTFELGEIPPEEVDAYLLSPTEARLLGVNPDYDDRFCVLFIFYEVGVESVPLRAAVVAEANLDVADET